MASTHPILPGQTLENPVTGERFTFIETAASSGGERLAFELALRPGGAVPLAHVHPIQTETFTVTHGRMRFRLGREHVVAEAGDVVEVPPGVVHDFANAGRLTKRGLPRSPFALAALARRFDHEAHAPRLSVAVQRFLLAPLLLPARLAGARFPA